MPSTVRSRSWCWTLNAEDGETEYPHLSPLTDRFRYLTWGNEVGEQGRPHLQGFAYFTEKKTMSFVKRALNDDRCHVEVMRTNVESSIRYCHKDGDYVEYGVRPQQGARTDLNELVDSISQGSSVSSIMMTNPIAYHQYGRTLDKVEDLVNRSRRRAWMTEGFWFWGPTGSGKTHAVLDGVDMDKVYKWNKGDNGWWDGYCGQEIVLIDDFRADIKYGFLLELVDKWPCTVPRRGREPMPFLAKKLYITAPCPPEDTYTNLAAHDSLDQLRRRFVIREFR